MHALPTSSSSFYALRPSRVLKLTSPKVRSWLLVLMMRRPWEWLGCLIVPWAPSLSNIWSISPVLLHSKDFAPAVSKVGNRVLPWRDRYNTNAGKVALINACLSSLPMFLMGFYLLSAGIHAGFDKHRGAFYWNAAGNKRKYKLVKWKLMCRPKNLGGLGIINTLVMNKCLLIKWWWKLWLVGPVLFGIPFLRLNTFLTLAQCLPVHGVDLSFGRTLLK